MTGAMTAGTVIHLAVLAERGTARDETVCAVLVYDDRGHRQLHPVGSSACVEQLCRLVAEASPVQLPLPLLDELPPPTSAGRTWQTWVLPSIPPSLRTLPPERLAAALAGQLCGGTTP